MKQRSCCSCTESFSLLVFLQLPINIRGHGAPWLSRRLWTGRPWVRTPLQPPRQGPWASPSLAVACSASACELRRIVNCCGRERLWVVVDLKWPYRNIRNEWMNIIFPFSVVDGIMGAGLFYVRIHACMQECMYISVYVCLCAACMCVRLANGFINVKTETK